MNLSRRLSSTSSFEPVQAKYLISWHAQNRGDICHPGMKAHLNPVSELSTFSSSSSWFFLGPERQHIAQPSNSSETEAQAHPGPRPLPKVRGSIAVAGLENLGIVLHLSFRSSPAPGLRPRQPVGPTIRSVQPSVKGPYSGKLAQEDKLRGGQAATSEKTVRLAVPHPQQKPTGVQGMQHSCRTNY